MNIRTDLALEEQEKYESDNVEIEGVALRKDKYKDAKIKVTKVEIINQAGAMKMGKPIGNYITIESPDLDKNDSIKNLTVECLFDNLKQLIKLKKDMSVFVVGLGNRDVTPDMLGPIVTDNLVITRHLINEYGKEIYGENEPVTVSAISPGVMGQTGLEVVEIIKGIISVNKVDCLIVVDALAARSINRLNKTIQITDTGICPGSGVGNNRKAIDSDTMNVPVIAIGVPTVVDALTIVKDCLKNNDCKNEINITETENMIVTPNNIDEAVRNVAEIIAQAMNKLFMQRI